jgi:hypothetical protein
METTSAIRGFYPKVRPLARCKRGTAKPAKKRTKGTHRNGFLTHSFLPVWGLPFSDFNESEAAFFRSLTNLCNLYGWQAPDTSGLPFPQNIATVMAKLETEKFDGAACMLLQDKGSPAKLATVKTFDTSYCLYYIPVRPFWRLKNDPKVQAHFELVKMMFAYLYQIVGVPYYREPGYLDNSYDSLENWLREIDNEGNEDEEENEFRKRQFKEYELLKKAGDELLREFQQPLNLALWETLLKQLPAVEKYERDLREVAQEFWKLATDYPKRAIKDNMHYELTETDGSDQIYWENYISFYWSGSDSLEQMLFEMVNNEFQEMGYQEEPLSIQYFDTPQEKTCHDFDFETRLFALLNALTGLLNDIDDEEPNA